MTKSVVHCRIALTAATCLLSWCFGILYAIGLEQAIEAEFANAVRREAEIAPTESTLATKQEPVNGSEIPYLRSSTFGGINCSINNNIDVGAHLPSLSLPYRGLSQSSHNTTSDANGSLDSAFGPNESNILIRGDIDNEDSNWEDNLRKEITKRVAVDPNADSPGLRLAAACEYGSCLCLIWYVATFTFELANSCA
jgi:hypothetical protein